MTLHLLSAHCFSRRAHVIFYWRQQRQPLSKSFSLGCPALLVRMFCVLTHWKFAYGCLYFYRDDIYQINAPTNSQRNNIYGNTATRSTLQNIPTPTSLLVCSANTAKPSPSATYNCLLKPLAIKQPWY